MEYEYFNPIHLMIEFSKKDGRDVLREGIAVDMFVSGWESEYGMDFPEFYLEEIEREYKTGLPVSVAAQYWVSLDSWFTDFVKEYEENTSE
jgi:hypothetical protein